MMNPDGSNDVQLTPAQSGLYPCADDVHPTWSSDGQSIAYACLAFSVGAAVPAGTYQIWKHALNGTPNNPSSEFYVASVPNTQDYVPAWSPDGNSIAFVKAGPGAQAAIARLDINSGYIYFLTQGGSTDFNPTWSPDSTQIAFSSTRQAATGTLISDGTNPSDGQSVTVGGQFYIFRIALTGLANEVWISPNSAATTLANLAAAINEGPGAGTSYGLGTSRNSQAFVSFTTSNSIVVQALQNGNQNDILTTSTSAHLTWSGVNLGVAPGAHHIFLMSAQCPEAQTGCLPASQLTAGSGDDTEPAWSPDGSTIAFVSNRTTAQNTSGKTQIYLVASAQPESATATATLISDGTANDTDPAWNRVIATTQLSLNVQLVPNPVTVSAGLATPSQVTVTVTDPSGNTVNGAVVTVTPPQTAFEGSTPIALVFSSPTTANGQATFTVLEANNLQQSYQFQFTVSATGVVNGKPASGSTSLSINIVGLGSLLPPLPPPGVSNQQRLPVGAPPYTLRQKTIFAQTAVQVATNVEDESRLDAAEHSAAFSAGSGAGGLLVEALDPLFIFLDVAHIGMEAWEDYKLWQIYFEAGDLAAKAQDPPDPNYTTVALPLIQAPQVLTPVGGALSPKTWTLLNQSLAVKAVIKGYLQALQTSANRYSTALSIGDLTSAALQRDAILEYEDTLVSLFNSDSQAAQNLLASFQQDGLPNVQLAAQEIATIQNEVAVNGLPSDMIQTLQQIGASPTDIAAIQNSVIATNSQPVAVDFFSLLQSEAQSSLNASAAFIVGARPTGPVNTLAGNLVYTPPVGTVLNSGTQTLSVLFTPTDTTDYTTATATVPLVVAPTPATVTIDPSSLTQAYDGTPKSVTSTTNPANLSVSVTYTQNGTAVASPTKVGTYSVTVTVTTPNYAGTADGTLIITGAGGCVGAPPGLVSWWAGDGNTSDFLGANNPSGSNGITFSPAVVGTGFTLGSGGYIDIPTSTSLANQQFTWSAWVNPAGPGPDNDYLGSVIVGQAIDSTHVAAQLLWRATDNRFVFAFGDTGSELIVSQDSFAPGQFYLVTGTYDGSTFKLFVNGRVEGQTAEAKTIPYSSLTWTIGSTDSTLRSTFPRTWNGVIDEVQVFNRALSQSEIQAIYTAAGTGECRALPTLYSVAPNNGQQGQQNLPVALTGQFTNWVQGTTTASFGAGVTVSSFNVNAATGATAVLNIDPAAIPGAQTVTVTTGSEVDTLANAFTVTPAPPVLLSLTPGAAQQGQQATVNIAGQFTHFVQGATTATFGPGINVASLTVNSATSATAVLNVDPNAPVGASAVAMTTGSEIVTLTNGFTVISGTPVLFSASPNIGAQAQQGLSVNVSGQYTHFAQGTTTANLGAGVTVVTLSVNSPTSLTALLNIDPGATIGGRVVTVTSGAEVVSSSNGFAVVAGTPTLLSVNPSSGQQGQKNLSIALTGEFTNWVQRTTTTSFGSGITVTSLTVNSPTSAVAVVNINPAAATVAHSVTLTTGSEIDTLANAFTVAAGTPTLLSVSPVSGQQGQQNLLVTINGQYTNWLQGTTAVSFGAGITVTSLTVNSAASAVATLNIGAAVATGARTVTMTTGSEVETLANSFTVITGAPGLVSMNPASAKQGQQNLLVTITGQFTNWTQGTTTASFGAGITVASLSVNSTTSAVAVLNIDPTAATGPRTVTLTTGSEVDSLANGFAVTPGTPVLLSVNPATGQQGQQNVSVALAGQYTNWVQGTTTASFGVGITVASVTVNSPTSATAVLNISASAATGTRTITVTTGSEVETLANSFTVVVGTPALLSASPATGVQGQQNLSVTLTGQFTNWVQGTTTPNFGAGITVASLTVTSGSSATAVINIDLSATVGTRTITMTTGAEVDSLVDGFSIALAVCTGAPSGAVGWWPGDGNYNDILGGDNGSPSGGVTFTQGQVNQAFSFNGADGVVTAPNTPATDLTADLTIEAWIKPTSTTNRGAIVAKGDGNDYANTYQLFYGNSVTGQSQNLLLSVSDGGTGASYFESAAGVVIPVGVFTHIAATIQGTTATLYVNGVSIPGLYYHNGQPANAFTANRFSDHGSLRIGARKGDFYFAGPIDEVSIYNRALTATEIQNIYNAGSGGKCKGQPTLSAIVPNNGQQGQQGLSVALIGYFTKWIQGTTTANFGTGISVSSLTVNSPTNATAVVHIDPAALPGPQSVTLTAGSEVDTLPNGFTVTPGTPALVSVNPGAGQQGQQINATITGQFTHFAQGTTTATFGPGITVSSLAVNSPTSATASINISPGAPIGASAVVMTTGSEVVTLNGGFSVIPGTPVLVSVNPNSGQQGQQNLPVTLAGQLTNWVQGTTTANFGAGITVASLMVNSATSATAILNIDPSAATGAHTVTLTTGSEIDTLTNGFTVIAVDRTAPRVLMTSPVNGAGDISLGANVVVTFSKAIDPSTVTTSTFEVTDYTTSVAVPGTVQVDSSNTIATFVPSQPFTSGGLFLVTLTTAIKDSVGNSLGANFSFSFATGPLTVGEADAMVFSVLNTAAPGGSAANNREADGLLFSILNTAAAGGSSANNREADALLFSVLNTAAVGGSSANNREADALLFSILNTAAGVGTGASTSEADGIIFSVNNTATSQMTSKHERTVHPPALVDSDGDGYPDALETALGSDPNDPNSIPVVHSLGEAESVIFSVINSGPAARAKAGPRFVASANLGLQPVSIKATSAQNGQGTTKAAGQVQTKEQDENQEARGDSHEVKAIAFHKANFFKKLFQLHSGVGVNSFRGSALR